MKDKNALVYLERAIATPHIQITPSGAIIDKNTSYNELLKAGKKLKQFEEVVESSMHWILGDLLNFAEGKNVYICCIISDFA